MNSISNNLALVGSPLTDDDLVSIIMNNVRAAFEVTVSNAQVLDTSITYEALEALLLSVEQCMREQSQPVPNLNTGVTAFAASCGRGNRGTLLLPTEILLLLLGLVNSGPIFPINDLSILHGSLLL
ncbi:hypothetical protein ACE6H2_019652 [Prunus campanulata]